jgi:hypothetical protein
LKTTGFALGSLCFVLSLTACQGSHGALQNTHNSQQGSTAQPQGPAVPGASGPSSDTHGGGDVNGSANTTPPSNSATNPVSIPSPTQIQTNDPSLIPTTNVVWALSLDGSSLEAIERSKGQIVYELHLTRRAQQVVKAESALWIVACDGTLSRFELGSGNVDEMWSIGGDIAPIAVSNGHVWIGHQIADSRRETQRPQLIELDSQSGALQAMISIGDFSDHIGDFKLIGSSLFVLLNDRFGLYQIDTDTLKVSEVDLGLPKGFGRGVLSGSSEVLWVINTFSGKIVSLNPESLKILATVDAPENLLSNTVDLSSTSPDSIGGEWSSFVSSGSSLFMMAEQDRAVLKLNQEGAVDGDFEVKEVPQAIAEISGQIWVSLPNRIVVLNPKTGKTIKKFEHVVVGSFAKSMGA